MSKNVICKYCIYSLLVVTPLGFLFKLYPGPGRWWFNDYGAGLLYEIFWILIVFAILHRKKFINKIPVWVFMITSALEVLQLWHPKFLEMIRSDTIFFYRQCFDWHHVFLVGFSALCRGVFYRVAMVKMAGKNVRMCYHFYISVIQFYV